MMKSLLGSCMSFLIVACGAVQHKVHVEKNQVEFAEVIYTDLDAMTPIRISCDSLKTFSNISRDTIVDRTEIAFLKSETSNLKTSESTVNLTGVDARVILVLHDIDGGEKEYCIGNGTIQIEEHIYGLPEPLNEWLRGRMD